MIAPIIIFALFSVVFPLGKLAMVYVAPIFLTATRMMLAGVLLLGWHWWSNEKKVSLDRSMIIQFGLIAFFNIYVTNVCEFWGLQYLSSGKTAFIYNLSPFISALISYWVFNEVMTFKKLLGIIIGFMGFLPILLHNSPSEEIIGGIGFLSWPEIALITAATATVIGWILMRSVLQKGVSVSYANGVSMFVGGIVALGTSYLVEPWNPLPYTNGYYFFLYMIVLMLISNMFCYNAYAYLLRFYTATFLTFVGFTSPLWAAAYGWLFLNESVGYSFILSCCAVFIGLWIFYFEELRLGYVHSE